MAEMTSIFDGEAENAMIDAIGLSRAGVLAARQLEQDGEAFQAVFNSIERCLVTISKAIEAGQAKVRRCRCGDRHV